MARIRKLPPESWDPELRESTRADSATTLEQGLMRIVAHNTGMAKGLVGFAGALKVHRSLPERLVELVRLRVAFHNQCRSCMAIRYKDAVNAGLTEDLVCSLENPMQAPELTAAEKLAVHYGELMASDHLAIDDNFYDELHEHFTEEQVVELGMTVAFFVGFGRLAATWHMVEDLPAAFRETEGEMTPWGEASVQVR